MITETIEMLRGGDFYGAGKLTEMAKGKHQLITGYKGMKRKIKRKKMGALWLRRLSR